MRRFDFIFSAFRQYIIFIRADLLDFALNIAFKAINSRKHASGWMYFYLLDAIIGIIYISIEIRV